jgi:hypothetical protein
LQETLAGDFAGVEVTSVEASNLEYIEQRADERAHAKAPQMARREGDSFSVPVGPRERLVRDFAPTSRHREDVRLPAQQTTDDEWTLHLGPGLKVTGAPRSVEGASPFGSYRVEVEAPSADRPGTLRVRTSVVLSRTRIAAADYPAFRAWCEAVDRALGQRAVLGK